MSVPAEEVTEKPGQVSGEERKQCGVLADQSEADFEIQVIKEMFAS